jgi:ferredoxin-NADP reductase
MTDDRILTVRVARIDRQTPEVCAFEFEHPLGGALPAYEPGAHLNVHLPGGFARPYSLAAAPEPGGRCRRWRIGVKREPASRGGSASLHERVRVGDLLAVSAPRNTFPLHAGAGHHLLLAGGIGLTPLLAMAQQLRREGVAFTLAVFARSPAHLPFAAELAELGPAVRRHFDQPADAAKLNLPRLLQDAPRDAHLYLCGPAGFMHAARDAAAGWPDERVHLEYFAPPDAAAGGAADEPFVLHLARRGIQVPVAADQTAVEALHEVGIDVPTSCQQGVCGTCVVPLAGGEADHRDYCLSAGDRRTQVALCCSRARGGVLRVEM